MYKAAHYLCEIYTVVVVIEPLENGANDVETAINELSHDV
jgi:hypothetical protein